MKKTAIMIVCLILAVAAGVWLGPNIIPPISIRVCHHGVAGGWDYPQEAFVIINNEMPEKIDALLGQFENQRHMIAITPTLGGYDIHMAGPFKSSLWDEMTQKKLYDRLNTRMHALDQEYRKLHTGKPNHASEAIAPQDGAQPQR
jgi:hypothetical protein